MTTFETIIAGLFFSLVGFLSGSVYYSRLLPKLILKKDVCQESDDHNPGAANVFKLCGTAMGILCLIMDMAKGFLPVYWASVRMDMTSFWFSVVMAAPALGHALGIFNGHHGGKCIAVSFGVLIAVGLYNPTGLIILCATYILFSTLIVINPDSRRSIVTFRCFGVLALVIQYIQGDRTFAVGCGIIAMIAVICHKRAIRQMAKESCLLEKD